MGGRDDDDVGRQREQLVEVRAGAAAVRADERLGAVGHRIGGADHAVAGAAAPRARLWPISPQPTIPTVSGGRVRRAAGSAHAYSLD